MNWKRYHPPINVEREFVKLNVIDENIEEGKDEEDSSENEEDKFGKVFSTGGTDALEDTDAFDPTEYIPAFTHFSYLFPQRDMMVCDLQGVNNSDTIPPTFELTDPSVHDRSKSGRRNVFDKTWKKQWRGRPL